jgi:hypothetical protein
MQPDPKIPSINDKPQTGSVGPLLPWGQRFTIWKQPLHHKTQRLPNCLLGKSVNNQWSQSK